jgi:hypothetical protein
MMTMACGVMAAAPMPCSSRAAMSSPGFWAAPHSADEMAKTARPMVNSRRGPNMSPSRLARISSVAKTSR